MSISEHFRYRIDSFQSDIFVSNIGITDVDVGCRISPTLRPMSMPNYGYEHHKDNVTRIHEMKKPSNVGCEVTADICVQELFKSPRMEKTMQELLPVHM